MGITMLSIRNPLLLPALGMSLLVLTGCASSYGTTNDVVVENDNDRNIASACASFAAAGAAMKFSRINPAEGLCDSICH